MIEYSERYIIMKKISLSCLALLLLVSTPALAESEDPFGTTAAAGIDGTVKSSAHSAVTAFLNYFLGFLGLLVVIMFIYAGVLFVTAQGDEKQLEKSKQIMLYATVGVLIIMLSYVIVNAITGVRSIVE